ncbi:MAG TPA: hypothetical protein VM619_02480 [Luteimonas sp.]|nr:hypothetical protein [Luteimonas sp.]
MDNDNVIPIELAVHRKREPALTDAELVAIRALLDDFAEIRAECPVARRLLRDRDALDG